MYFVIVGQASCHFTAQAFYIAEFLSNQLPNFKIYKEIKPPEYWEQWLSKTNVINGWHHYDCPIIWKELTYRKGKRHYLGGLSNFWEYCYDYYKLETLFSHKDKNNLLEDLIQYYDCKYIQNKRHTDKNCKNVLFYGGSAPSIDLILLNFIKSEFTNRWNTNIYLIMSEKSDEKYYENLMENLSIPCKYRVTIKMLNKFDMTLYECELLIVLGDYERRENESLHTWLDRNHKAMSRLAENINFYGRKKLKIIFAMHGPVCFNATIFVNKIRKVETENIVAVTADVGLEMLNAITKSVKIPLENLGAPPVWGFIGLNQIIDIDHIIQKYDVYRPNTRVVTSNIESTLNLGVKYSELRFLGYMKDELENVWQIAYNLKEETRKKLLRPSSHAKTRALMSLIDNWYFKNGNIISLGIVSKGTHDIPIGIVFSQPVVLCNDTWVAMKNFPSPRRNNIETWALLPMTMDILRHYANVDSVMSLDKSVQDFVTHES